MRWRRAEQRPRSAATASGPARRRSRDVRQMALVRRAESVSDHGALTCGLCVKSAVPETATAPTPSGGAGPRFASAKPSGMLQMISRRFYAWPSRLPPILYVSDFGSALLLRHVELSERLDFSRAEVSLHSPVESRSPHFLPRPWASAQDRRPDGPSPFMTTW